MRAVLLMGALGACVGGDGADPEGLVLPEGQLPTDHPWVMGGPGLALTSAPAAPVPDLTPLVITDSLLELTSSTWTASRPTDAPAGVALTSDIRRTTAAPVLTIEHAVAPRVPIEVSVGVRTTGLSLGPRGGGAALIIEERDAEGERTALHDGAQRLSGDTAWRTQAVRIEPRSKTRSLHIRLEAAHGRAAGETAFRELSVRVVPPEQRAGAVVAGHHERTREVSLGRVTRPALMTRAGEHWTADVPAAGGTLTMGYARPRRGVPGDVCVFAVVDQQRTELGCMADDEAGRWSSGELVVPPGETARRVRLGVTGPSGAIAFLADPAVRSGDEIAAGRPDLALIVIDTLRADHLGMQGYTERPTSPNIDAFAGRSLRYAEARSTSGWTATSLGTVVTGLMPSAHRAGARRERAHSPASARESAKQRHRLTFRGLRADRPTLPELLRREGYRTMGWVDNTFFSAPYGFARGFSQHDRYAGDDLVGVAEGVQKATAFLDALPPRSERAPYLLVLHAIDPHAPYQARVPAEPGFEVPESLRGEMEHIEAPEQEAWSVTNPWNAGRVDAEAMKVPYDSEIRYMDGQIGPLLERLEADGAGIVLLSDHGEEFSEHGGFSHGRTLFEELVRVPLVVREPGTSPRRGVVASPVALDAVAGTMLGFAGLSAPPESARPLPSSTDATAATIPFLAEGAYKGDDLTGVRIGRLKAVLRHATGLRSERLETAAKAWERGRMVGDLVIHDLDADPAETLDVSSGLEEAERGPLLSVLYRHIAGAEPGVHLRCAGEGPAVRISTSEPISRFVPFAWGPAHAAEIDATRRSMTVTPGDDGPLWGVLRVTAEASALSIEVGGVAVTADVSADPDFPTALAGSPCVAWRIRAEGSTASLDADEVANLEALGYIGD
jgi:arylsulfatase A-like enzyme